MGSSLVPGCVGERRAPSPVGVLLGGERTESSVRGNVAAGYGPRLDQGPPRLRCRDVSGAVQAYVDEADRRAEEWRALLLGQRTFGILPATGRVRPPVV